MTARKPTKLKIISGTGQPSRDFNEIEFEPLAEVPEPPHWLPNEHAIAEWKKLAPIFTANGLMSEINIAPLGILCSLHGILVMCFQQNLLPNGHTLAQYRALINDFGMTPVAQTRVKPQEKPKKNPFEDNGRPSEKRSA